MVTLKNNTIMNPLISILILLLMSNCSKDKVVNDEELSIQRIPYLGTELRVNGYYYYEYDNMVSIYFLFRNGVFLLGGSFEKEMLNEREGRFMNGDYYSTIKDLKTVWGVFFISNKEILIERWHPHNVKNKVYLHKGIILNDSTFNITSVYHQQENISNFSQTFLFKTFSPKPDSTNSFIK